MSLFLVILLLSVWARLLDTIREGDTPKAFVDDRSVYTTTLPALLKALKLTLQFDSSCAIITNVDKSHVLVSTSDVIDDLHKFFDNNDIKLPVCSHFKLVGHSIDGGTFGNLDVANARLSKGCALTKRINVLPNNSNHKKELISQHAVATITFASEHFNVPRNLDSKFYIIFIRNIWGKRHIFCEK